MKGEGLTYRERQKDRVKCLKCGEEMVAGFLVVHHQTQNGVEAGEIGQCDTPPPYGEP